MQTNRARTRRSCRSRLARTAKKLHDGGGWASEQLGRQGPHKGRHGERKLLLRSAHASAGCTCTGKSGRPHRRHLPVAPWGHLQLRLPSDIGTGSTSLDQRKQFPVQTDLHRAPFLTHSRWPGPDKVICLDLCQNSQPVASTSLCRSWPCWVLAIGHNLATMGDCIPGRPAVMAVLVTLCKWRG